VPPSDRHDQPQVGFDELPFGLSVAGPHAPSEILLLLGREQLDAADVLEIEGKDLSIAAYAFRLVVGLTELARRLGEQFLEGLGRVGQIAAEIVGFTHGLLRRTATLSARSERLRRRTHRAPRAGARDCRPSPRA